MICYGLLTMHPTDSHVIITTEKDMPGPWSRISQEFSSWSSLLLIKKNGLNQVDISLSQSCIRSIYFTSTVVDAGLSLIPIDRFFSLCIAFSRNSIASVAITVITPKEPHGQSMIIIVKTVDRTRLSCIDRGERWSQGNFWVPMKNRATMIYLWCEYLWL